MTNPLTPADCDLRGLDYMPLFGNHLFGSEFNAAATDAEWRAALTLWWAAWNQVPAGSLPNDDAALCRLADLGRDVKCWKKLRVRALHGFVECSDGRLYHEFICKQALVAWDKRVKERERKAKWRAEKDTKSASHDADVPRDKHGTEQGHDADVPADVKQRDGTGRDDASSVANATDAGASEAAKKELFDAGKSLLIEQGMAKAQCGSFIGKLAKDYGKEVALEAVRSAVVNRPLQAADYLIATCKSMSGQRLQAITVPSSETVEQYQARMAREREADKNRATKPPADLLALVGKTVRTA